MRRFVSPHQLLVRASRIGSGFVRFESYESALERTGAGYDDDELAAVVVEKTRRFRDGLAHHDRELDLGSLRSAIAVSTADLRASPLRVLDYGGAAGYHYFVARALVSQGVRLDWRVVETPTMARVATELSSPELGFFDDLQAAVAAWPGPPHLTLASGVLHYHPDPLGALRSLVLTRSEVLFITRTAVLRDGRKRVIVQRSTLADNGPGALPEGFQNRVVAYPATFVPRREVEETLARSYRIDARLAEGKAALRSFGPSVEMVGYVCRHLESPRAAV